MLHADFFFSFAEILVAFRRETKRSRGLHARCGTHGGLKSQQSSLVEVDLTSHKQVPHAGERRVFDWGVWPGTPQGILTEVPRVGCD